MSRDWTNAKISPRLVEAVTGLGFSEMTPVQASVIPLFSHTKDVVVQAVTGSGKTLAYLVPVIEKLLRLDNVDSLQKGHTFALVIAPTRELAEQIYKVLQQVLELLTYDKCAPLRSQLIIGGQGTVHGDHKKYMAKRPHIMVCTPGRLLDLVQAPSVSCSSVEMLVLDEADRLLDLGFSETITKILGLLPKQKRVGLFSATISDAVSEIVRLGLRNPVKIVVNPTAKATSSTPTSLAIEYVKVDAVQKIPLLLHQLRSQSYKKAIVYFPTCVGVTFWHGILQHLLKDYSSITLCSLHGKLAPQARQKTLDRFANGVAARESPFVLLTTDVAARGLDIPNVDLVIQLDPPTDPNVFVHRAGRAGRAGKRGTSVVYLNHGREEDYIEFMQVKKVRITLNRELQQVVDSQLDVKKTLEDGHGWMLQDRARHDLGVRSFVSYIRFYSKHTASSIFRIQNLDIVQAAQSYFLIRLPSMPELRKSEGLPKDGWIIDTPIDWDAYAYVNTEKEQSRQKDLENKQEIEEKKRLEREKRQKNNTAWSETLERKQHAQERREKRKNKQIAKKSAQLEAAGNDSDSDMEVDWKDLVREKKRKTVTADVGQFDL